MQKLLFLSVYLIGLTFTASAQDDENSNINSNKNVVKLNLFALPLKNFSLQYERAVANRISVGATVRYMPKGKLPFKDQFKDLADDPETERQLDNFEIGNFAIMPEARFYVGKRGALHGFYLGLFGNIANYKSSLLYEYDDNGTTETIPMTGTINSFSGGLMLGAQWKLGEKIMLDWWILGPHYGTAKGEFTGKKAMDIDDQESLRQELNDMELPFGIKQTNEINSEGATVNLKGPWAGIRAGLAIGIRF